MSKAWPASLTRILDYAVLVQVQIWIPATYGFDVTVNDADL